MGIFCMYCGMWQDKNIIYINMLIVGPLLFSL